MLEIAFRVPAKFVPRRAERIIERTAKEHGLILGMKAELASFPGSIHWHYKKKGVSGTLELTLWPAEKKIWAQVQAGRKAGWIFEELPGLRRRIEAALRAR
jgi:hypothetical protein